MLKVRLRPYLEMIETRQITNRDLAKELGCSESHLSHTLAILQVSRVQPDYKLRKTLVQARKDYRKHLANTLPPEEAAALANCSIRTIYRYKL